MDLYHNKHTRAVVYILFDIHLETLEAPRLGALHESSVTISRRFFYAGILPQRESCRMYAIEPTYLALEHLQFFVDACVSHQ